MGFIGLCIVLLNGYLSDKVSGPILHHSHRHGHETLLLFITGLKVLTLGLLCWKYTSAKKMRHFLLPQYFDQSLFQLYLQATADFVFYLKFNDRST